MNSLAPSQNPPGGLPVSRVPMFFTVGFDDNGFSGLRDPDVPWGITWASRLFASRKNPSGTGNSRTYDGCPCRVTFYYTTEYISGEHVIDPPDMVKQSWHTAYKTGHEAGNHSHNHPEGVQFSVSDWEREIERCNTWLQKSPPAEDTGMDGSDPSKGAGIAPAHITGFRAPFIAYNNAMFTALQNKGFIYDSSIQEGWQPDQDGTNYFWPYTLDKGSPGNDLTAEMGISPPLSDHPGLWEIPVYTVVVPPDELCPQYGVSTGFRAKMKQIDPSFNIENGKITGIDWNILVEYKMTKEEYLATLQYTLDLRISGNRCPFILGAHSDMYSPGYDFPPNISWQKRQEALEEFVCYALSKPAVRIVTVQEILDWIRNPVLL